MLRELRITGLGVIDDLDLELHAGLNVLTGETGAGKTMVTVGLALALGRRASASLIRPGAGAARVQASFDAPERALQQGWAEDGELVLARSVAPDGRSTARVGGQLAPVSALAELAGDLVEAHGQHEGGRLLSAAAQTDFLDRFCGRKHSEAVAGLREEHGRLRDARAALAELVERERDREREIDLLAYQIREIESAAPRPGETRELRVEESRLAHAERLLGHAGAAERSLGDEEGSSDTVGSAASSLRSAAELDPRAEGVAARAEALAAELVELARDVRTYRERLELDPERLEAVRQRIGALNDLFRKYGDGEEAVLTFVDDAGRRLDRLTGAAAERTRLEEGVAELGARVAELAAVISRGRGEHAPRLASALEAELHELGMEGAEVEVALVTNAETTSSGAERAELRFAGGPGQPRLPFAKVASGGELSRAMLACRSVLVDLDAVPTLVFDEVDAGIGGRAGVAVGRRLAALARSRQVVVVTHLPQIASFADRHVRVTKRGGRASVTVLDEAGRVKELTRMLSGLPGSEAAATHAEELLAEAGRSKAHG
ncbi:MAG: DNA repair protein RecN [Actinomycetota bacterium]